jgi:hypothetical protein
MRLESLLEDAETPRIHALACNNEATHTDSSAGGVPLKSLSLATCPNRKNCRRIESGV